MHFTPTLILSLILTTSNLISSTSAQSIRGTESNATQPTSTDTITVHETPQIFTITKSVIASTTITWNPKSKSIYPPQDFTQNPCQLGYQGEEKCADYTKTSASLVTMTPTLLVTAIIDQQPEQITVIPTVLVTENCHFDEDGSRRCSINGQAPQAMTNIPTPHNFEPTFPTAASNSSYSWCSQTNHVPTPESISTISSTTTITNAAAVSPTSTTVITTTQPSNIATSVTVFTPLPTATLARSGGGRNISSPVMLLLMFAAGDIIFRATQLFWSPGKEHDGGDEEKIGRGVNVEH